MSGKPAAGGKKKDKKKHPHSARNKSIIRGLVTSTESARRHNFHLKKKLKFGPQPNQEQKQESQVRKVEPRWYTADDTPRPVFSRKSIHRPTRLRKSITPGTVLIVLAGRFRGKRVVFLKQLASGLLLVTGPYKVNGVPLRRLNQAYVIATSTKVQLNGVNVDKVDDGFFKRAAPEKAKKGGEEFFAKADEKKPVSQEKKDAQVAVDKALLASLKKTPELHKYLNAHFSLKKGQYPHELHF